MADRSKYNTCMKPFISGKKTRQERTEAFCIGAKVCSGKAQNESIAKKLCLEARSQPRPPKLRKKTARQRQQEQDACDPAVFKELISQFNNVYVAVNSDRCQPCRDLDGLIRQTDLPHQVVIVPDVCTEILDSLEVDAFPTIIKMSKGKIVSRHVGNPEDTIEKMRKGL